MQLKQMKYGLALGVISIVGIVIIQTQWIFTTWDMNKKELNHTVWLALKETAVNIASYHDCAMNSLDPVQSLSGSCYLVELPCEFSKANLTHLLQASFNKSNLSFNYHVSIYNCNTYTTEYLGSIQNNWDDKRMGHDVEHCLNQKHPDLVNYFIISLSGQNHYLFKQIKIWIISSILVLIILIFFTYTILSFYNQKQLTELQKDFINNMTHEFKTPISSISISGTVLNEYREKLPERANKYIQIINLETKRLNHLVESVLQSAKVDKNKSGMNFEEIALHDLIIDAIGTVNNQNCKIITDLAQNNPIVRADKMHVENLFLNLIDNAIKYNERKPVITISTQQQGKSMLVEVQDNGIGIHKKNLKKVFKKFYRVSTGDVHDVKGFGIGLFYVSRVCRAHKWSIKLKSELEAGSVFTIKIPYLHG